MPIRYVGRESFFRGKTLIEIASNLRNSGEGRVVARVKFFRYEEQSYYRLTKAVVDLSNKDKYSGEFWGIKVFRGENFGERQINSGKKADWRLIPKEDEDKFCTELAQPRAKITVPKYTSVPPLLELLTKQEMSARGVDTSQPLRMNLRIQKGFLNKAVLEDV